MSKDSRITCFLEEVCRRLGLRTQPDRPRGRARLIVQLESLMVGAFLLGGAVMGTRADVVLEWNQAMTDYAAPLSGMGALGPNVETRAYAMAHIAMLRAIERVGERERRSASPAAAAAQAAHDVLVHEFPAGTASFDSLLATQLAAIPESQAKARGISIGAGAAARMIAARANDGSANADGPYTPGTDPGDYQFTPPFDGPPFNGFAAGVNWSAVTPFALKSGDQFRAPPPYSVTDLEYTFDLNEIKALGSAGSTARTDNQTQLAIFWYESSGLGWNRIARTLASAQGRDLRANAKVFAALNTALADGYIASFDSKYTYNFWRPITAIRRAGNDGNDLTAADPAWQPLLLTPPVPDYPSGHAAVGAAAATVLIAFFGDEKDFTLSSTMSTAFPFVGARTFHRISDAAKENATSRMLVGIHFRLACTKGYEQGVRIGTWVANQFCSEDDKH
jgi:hypothetical protein